MSTDPLRWLDNSNSIPELKGALKSIGAPSRLPPGALERVGVALAALGPPAIGAVTGVGSMNPLATAATSPSAAASAVASTGTSTAAAGVGTSVAHGVLGLSLAGKLALVSALCVAGAGLWGVTNHGATEPAGTRQGSAAVDAPSPRRGQAGTAPSVGRAATAAREAEPPSLGDAAARAEPSVAATGHADARSTSAEASGPARVRTKAASEAPDSTLAAEALLLESARKSIEASPAKARQLLARYDARYPRGQLKHEAELLRVRLAVAEGKSEEARRSTERVTKP